jgi:hypothetical protein
MLKLGGDVLPPKNPEGLKAFRECLGKAFDAHAAEQDDKKITRDGLTDVIFSAGARMLNWELEAAWKDHGELERIDRQVCETISVTGPRFLNDEWGKEDESMEHFNPYQQTYEAFKVLADSYGQNGLIDIVNLRYLLTSCGEEMSDEEFDEALREIGQSSKGFFHMNKLLTSYHGLAKQVGRGPKNDEQYASVLQDIESNKKTKANDRRQSKIMSPGVVAMVAGAVSRSSSKAGSRAPSEKAESVAGDKEA